jgi:hypothetical protein
MKKKNPINCLIEKKINIICEPADLHKVFVIDHLSITFENFVQKLQNIF